jgi:hypothetical protein
MNTSAYCLDALPVPTPRAAPAGPPAAFGAILGETVMVRVEQLRESDTARSAGVDHDHVRTLAEAGDRLPPISVHFDTMQVIDGMHRLAAARLNGAAEIEVRYFHGSLEDAFCLGVKANVTHGLPLIAADRQAAALRILRSHPHLSDRSIARTAGLGAKAVAALRDQVTDGMPVAARVGGDGRVRPLDPAEGRLAASRIIAERPDASLREIAREAGISVGTARDVRIRLAAGDDPIPARQRSSEAPRRTRPQDDLRRTAAPVDPELVLDVLRRDPTLRYSDSGRALLRWLNSRLVTADQWRDAARAVPPHCLVNVAKVARECARSWSGLAEELESAVTAESRSTTPATASET